MKKIFTNNLPHRGKVIDWKASVGYKVKFIYNSIQGEIKIVAYNEVHNLEIKYLDEYFTEISSSQLKACKLGDILRIKTKKYKYQIGDIITNIKFGKLQILEQRKIKYNKSKYAEKAYKYKCLICNNEDVITEGSLNKHRGCNVCGHNKIKIGYNDMWTTNPELAKLLLNPEDGYKYTQNANQYVDWVCPNCGNVIKHKKISTINIKGLICPKCSDGVSYPEKFMYNILDQLELDFTYQYNPKWCKYKLNNKNKKGFYDFYFKIKNEEYIVEMDGGLGHGKNNKMSGETGTESKLIDNMKDKLANEHEIKVIRIDCDYGKDIRIRMNYIKEHILNSKLNDLFDLNKIDWLKCYKYICNSLVKKACNLWNLNKYTIIEISKIMKLSDNTIRKYLKQGVQLGWCDYNPKKIMKKILQENKTMNQKKVICLNNEQIFDSIVKAANIMKVSDTDISECCKNKKLKTGEYLQWQYYNEYLIKPKKLLTNEEIDELNRRKRKVICLNNNRIFNSITEASKYYNIKYEGNISLCCQGKKRKSAGKDPDTGKKLKWMYYDDYLEVKGVKELC